MGTCFTNYLSEMELEKFKHKIQITVRFSDLDAMGHVNNATYLTYLEEARLSYYKDVLNMNVRDLEFNAVVARIEIDYIHQIKLGDKLEVYSRTSKIGNKSVDLEHVIAIVNNEHKKIAAKALTKLVSYDYKKNESTVIPQAIKNIIEDFEKKSQ
ncbi:acyl-CoA thioesterase [Melioribacteraceae bacterium 4301-Me]|uniref:acyl-CoA thioesterase n=1 Tax=Pyranulibacter aquaticus TaxID=3163344 RepID=UPI0035983CE0